MEHRLSSGARSNHLPTSRDPQKYAEVQTIVGGARLLQDLTSKEQHLMLMFRGSSMKQPILPTAWPRRAGKSAASKVVAFQEYCFRVRAR